jgi:hypothetical protein
MLSRYPGRCHNCGEPITIATPIHYDHARKLATHAHPDPEHPHHCGPPEPDTLPVAKPQPFRPTSTPQQDWCLGKTD